ncbi:MFS family permease [Bacillus mesophilus]|nr:MFS transporter [Bacillus mesophilus]MBM7661985.1 MFS family permease [Bacillus mesophilus]
MYMIEKGTLHTKKTSNLLLAGVGISTLGDFIYLVAINILVLRLTGSPAAVAGLWIMSPLAGILTKFWSGSFIDRMNKRSLMIVTDLIRAAIIIFLPFISSLWLLYMCLFFLSIAKSFFEPTSMTYITSVIPKEHRKQFNSFRSIFTSGAFLIGPAIAGVLIITTSIEIAIWLNALSFMISAVVLLFLPNIDKEAHSRKNITIKDLFNDWGYVIQFSRQHTYVIFVYFLAQFFMLVTLGMDAQEVVFTQKVLGLSETQFGLLISITGVGSILGAFAVSILAKRMSIQLLISSGFLLVALGYVIYALSFSFLSVAFGFIILGFFNAFSNTGFTTFYQNNVPVEMMGRISSVYGVIVSVFQIIFILLIGFTGELIPLRYSIIISSILVLSSGLLLAYIVHLPSRKQFFSEESVPVQG